MWNKCLAAGFATALGVFLSASGLAGSLVPYKGIVSGEIVVSGNPDGDGAMPVSGSGIEVASHLGKGLQQDYSGTLKMGMNGDGRIGLTITEGKAVSVAANGDTLPLSFTLGGTLSLKDMTIVYTGTYEILPGGTGRFAFPEGPELGSGTINGSATLTTRSVGGQGFPVLIFEHTFDGTLYSVGANRGSKK